MPSGTSTLDPVVTKLATLGLEYQASALPELLEQATREDLSPLAPFSIFCSAVSSSGKTSDG